MTVADLMRRSFGEQHVAAFILVLARVSPLFVLAPLFSSKLVPPRVRGIVAVALAIGLSPVVSKGVTLPTGVMDVTWLVLKEMLVGGAFAFAVGGLAAALSAAGSFIDTSIGFSYGSLVDPLTGTQSTVLAQAYSLVGMLIFIAIGGDGWVVAGPRAHLRHGRPRPGAGRSAASSAASTPCSARSSSRAIEVAGPVLLALILTDAAFGVVSRVVPQLNVFAVGFPAKIVVGLLLVTATLPFVAGWIGERAPAGRRRRPPSDPGGLMAGEKTEKATPKKRKEAREKGQVARSTDLQGAVVLMAGIIALGSAGPGLVQRMGDVHARRDRADQRDPSVVSMQGIGGLMMAAGEATLLAVAPIAAGLHARRRRSPASAWSASGPPARRSSPTSSASTRSRAPRTSSGPTRWSSWPSRSPRSASSRPSWPSRCCPGCPSSAAWSASRPPTSARSSPPTWARWSSAPPSPTCSSASPTSPGRSGAPRSP